MISPPNRVKASLALRSLSVAGDNGTAFAFAHKVEVRCIQDGMKQSLTTPTHLADDHSLNY